MHYSRQGKARQGEARQGKARQGKQKPKPKTRDMSSLSRSSQSKSHNQNQSHSQNQKPGTCHRWTCHRSLSHLPTNQLGNTTKQNDDMSRRFCALVLVFTLVLACGSFDVGLLFRRLWLAFLWLWMRRGACSTNCRNDKNNHSAILNTHSHRRFKKTQ